MFMLSALLATYALLASPSPAQFSSTGLSPSGWFNVGGQGNGYYGWDVAGVGDVNGDGYDDVVVGHWWYSGSVSLQGRALLYLGSSIGLSSSPSWQFASGQYAAGAGVRVEAAGDVNGDGYADIAVVADQFDGPEMGEGRVWVFHGSPTGPSPTPDWQFDADQTGARLAEASRAGDVNGDGFDDLVVGAWFFDGAAMDCGRAYCFYGSASGLPAAENWFAEGSFAGEHFGSSVAGPGDVNGDGYDDVLIGAQGDDGLTAYGGAVYLYYGSSTGLSGGLGWSYECPEMQSSLGICASGWGDVNGDGYDDIVFAAHGYSGGQAEEGRAYMFLGGAVGPGVLPDWTVESNQAGATLGRSLSIVGDMSGDGLDDVVIGANNWDGGQIDEGMVAVYLGSSCGLNLTPTWTAESNQAGAALGIGVAGAGDQNGDSLADIVVGAWLYDGSAPDEGAAFGFLGSLLDDCNGNGVDDSLDISTGVATDCNGNLVPDSCDVECLGVADVNGNGVPDVCDPPGLPFCFGDAADGVHCQCMNDSGVGLEEGCLNSLAHGALLQATGSNVLASDDLVLNISQARPSQPSIIIQGAMPIAVPFKDGKLCMGFPTDRLEVVFLDAIGGGSTTGSIATQGSVSAPGTTTYYQAWYRDPGPGSPCGQGSNMTSGLRVDWQ